MRGPPEDLHWVADGVAKSFGRTSFPCGSTHIRSAPKENRESESTSPRRFADAGVRTNSTRGEATVEFGLNDAVTSFTSTAMRSATAAPWWGVAGDRLGRAVLSGAQASAGGHLRQSHSLAARNRQCDEFAAGERDAAVLEYPRNR